MHKDKNHKYMEKMDKMCEKKVMKDTKEMVGSAIKKHEKTMHSSKAMKKGSY